MNLRDLRTFVEIAEAGGVARAAARLHMTQPTASRQLHALEAELGVPLFDRIGRRVQLTSEGEELLQRSRRLLRDAEAIDDRARALDAAVSGFGALISEAGFDEYRRRWEGVARQLTSAVE